MLFKIKVNIILMVHTILRFIKGPRTKEQTKEMLQEVQESDVPCKSLLEGLPILENQINQIIKIKSAA